MSGSGAEIEAVEATLTTSRALLGVVARSVTSRTTSASLLVVRREVWSAGGSERAALPPSREPVAHMTSALLAVVYGDPLPDDLTRSLSTAGLNVVHPSRSTGIPRVADIDALLVRVQPESLNGYTDPRTSDVMADVTLRELARSRRRARRGRTQSARVDAIIVPPDPDLDDLTRKVQASIDGSSEGVIELAHPSGSVSGLRGTGSGTEG